MVALFLGIFHGCESQKAEQVALRAQVSEPTPRPVKQKRTSEQRADNEVCIGLELGIIGCTTGGLLGIPMLVVSRPPIPDLLPLSALRGFGSQTWQLEFFLLHLKMPLLQFKDPRWDAAFGACKMKGWGWAVV